MKDLLSKSEVHFWMAILGGVAMTMAAFFNLKIEVVEAKKDIAVIMRDISGIKESLQREPLSQQASIKP